MISIVFNWFEIHLIDLHQNFLHLNQFSFGLTFKWILIELINKKRIQESFDLYFKRQKSLENHFSWISLWIFSCEKDIRRYNNFDSIFFFQFPLELIQHQNAFIYSILELNEKIKTNKNHSNCFHKNINISQYLAVTKPFNKKFAFFCVWFINLFLLWFIRNNINEIVD